MKKQLLILIAMMFSNGLVMAVVVSGVGPRELAERKHSKEAKKVSEQWRGLALLNQGNMQSPIFSMCNRDGYCPSCEVLSKHLAAGKEYSDIVKALGVAKNEFSKEILRERLKAKNGSEEKSYYETLNDNAKQEVRASVKDLLKQIDASFIDQEESKMLAILNRGIALTVYPKIKTLY